MFMQKNLRDIQKTKKNFAEVQNIQKYCLLLENSQNCSEPESVIRFFDGTYAQDFPQLNDPDFTNISYILSEANKLLFSDHHPCRYHC